MMDGTISTDQTDYSATSTDRPKTFRLPGAFGFLGQPESLSFNDRLLIITAIATACIAVVAVCTGLWFARPVLIPITTAFVLSILLAPATEWLRRRAVPTGLRALIVVLLAFTLFIYGLYLVIQPGAAWIEKLPTVMEQARDKLAGVENAVSKVQDVSEQVNDLAKLGNDKTTEEVTVQGPEIGDILFASARTFIVQILFTAVLTYFFLASRLDIRRKLILLRGTMSGMRQTARMLRAIEQKVGAYMFTMLMINIGLGVATGLAMWAIGMPSPYIWGGLAAILNFIPYLGPIILTSLLTISGLVQFDNWVEILTVPAIFIAFNFIESNFVTPTLIGVRLTISPLAIILNVSFWTWMWGPAGAVISIPVFVIFKTICDHSDFLRPIGLLIGEADTFRPVKRGLQRLQHTP
ncbi:AI-2E family transporter [Hyphococcus formosus]|uniref:AI-2E family transporter n=1 Tax=Hyphococcus formosus TaxID=3143534 RepID=UPI00398BB283